MCGRVGKKPIPEGQAKCGIDHLNVRASCEHRLRDPEHGITIGHKRRIESYHLIDDFRSGMRRIERHKLQKEKNEKERDSGKFRPNLSEIS